MYSEPPGCHGLRGAVASTGTGSGEDPELRAGTWGCAAAQPKHLGVLGGGFNLDLFRGLAVSVLFTFLADHTVTAMSEPPAWPTQREVKGREGTWRSAPGPQGPTTSKSRKYQAAEAGVGLGSSGRDSGTSPKVGSGIGCEAFSSFKWLLPSFCTCYGAQIFTFKREMSEFGEEEPQDHVHLGGTI